MDVPAYFTDGVTAQRHRVRVSAAGGRLLIRDEARGAIDEWPVEGLRLLNEVYRGQPVRVGHRGRGDACLTFDDPSVGRLLQRHAPHLRFAWHTGGRALGRIALWGLALLVVVAGLMFAVPKAAGPLAHAVPLAWEEAMGDAVMGVMADEDGVCTGAGGLDVLEILTRRLAGGEYPRYRFKVYVADTGEVNAFAAPGGHIVLFRGLIESAATPREVAGVLAHEMAHVVERHPVEGLIRSTGLRLLFSALFGDVSDTVASFAGLGETLLSLSYGRGDEAEADRVGVEMLNRADIRADGLVDFFRRLEDKGRGTPPQALAFLSTHPLHAERIEAIERLGSGRNEALDAASWTALKGVCETQG
jgi:Zn-dependent protease with chaperone function